jgi:2',3'-cyclic-nucleotide 2'-phosphodiesterase/3'-nucleotidase
MLAFGSIMRLLRLALLSLSWLAGSTPSRAEEAKVTILHTTDLHGALTAYDYLADRPAARGLVKLATIVRSVRSEGAPVLLLDAGDAIQGSPLETFYRRGERTLEEPVIGAMNRVGYDAMAVGNHEFSYGWDELDRARTASRHRWLAANVERLDGTPAFDASWVTSSGAVRVGVVGITTPAVPRLEDSAHVAGLRFTDAVSAARREVARLREKERCDVVVLLAHTGLERDPVTGRERRGDTPGENVGHRLASEAGADVVILGHTHQTVEAAEIGGALVTQAGRFGEALGRVDLVLKRGAAGDRWTIASRRARVLAVEDGTPADSALARFAEPYHRAAQESLGRRIGLASRDVDAPAGRFADSALWELIHRAQLRATGADVSLAALADPSARIARGPITVRDAFRVYGYDNTIGVVAMTGATLKRTLEQSARYFAGYSFDGGGVRVEPGMPGYNFDAAAGVSYAIDLARPPGDRIVGLSWKGAPLAPDRVLRVAVNNYRMNGGGGFEDIRTAPRLTPPASGGRAMPAREIRDLIIEELERSDLASGGARRGIESGPLVASLTPATWSLLPDYATAAERPLIDRLVHEGVLPDSEAERLRPNEPAQRRDVAAWIARAFGWSAATPAPASAGAPDSLRPWIDGFLSHGVAGAGVTYKSLKPTAIARLGETLDWCERAARTAGLAVAATRDTAFRAGLVQGIALARPARGRPDTLTRVQALGLISNLRFPTLRILETTDFHGAILPGAPDRRTGRSRGGSAVLAAHLARLRAENPAGTVLVDGGDLFQGTMISNLQFGRPVVEQMNALGYAATAIGNHELDWSADTLERRVESMRFSALGANMIERSTGKLPRWVRADTVVARRGVRVGILGLCYRWTPTVTLPRFAAPFRFEDDSLTASQRVPELRTRSDAVIVVGHIPAESDSLRTIRRGDLKRVAQVAGVDACFGGHSHNQVIDRVNGVPAMIAGSHGTTIGVCDLVVDPVRHRVLESSTRLVDTFADEVTPDSTWVARMARWNAAVAPIASVVIAQAARPMGRSRGGDGAVGSLVADAMRAAAQADIAMQNTGGLRADLPQGPITRGGIYEVMPFDNTIIVLDLSATDVRRALEQSLEYGRITQVSGIRYGYDRSQPRNHRVVLLTDSSGVALDTTRTYRVAVNDFMATGGDNYDVLSAAPHREDLVILVRNAIEEFIVRRAKSNGGVLDYQPDGRVKRVGGPAPQERP